MALSFKDMLLKQQEVPAKPTKPIATPTTQQPTTIKRATFKVVDVPKPKIDNSNNTVEDGDDRNNEYYSTKSNHNRQTKLKSRPDEEARKQWTLGKKQMQRQNN